MCLVAPAPSVHLLPCSFASCCFGTLLLSCVCCKKLNNMETQQRCDEVGLEHIVLLNVQRFAAAPVCDTKGTHMLLAPLYPSTILTLPCDWSPGLETCKQLLLHRLSNKLSSCYALYTHLHSGETERARVREREWMIVRCCNLEGRAMRGQKSGSKEEYFKSNFLTLPGALSTRVMESRIGNRKWRCFVLRSWQEKYTAKIGWDLTASIKRQLCSCLLSCSVCVFWWILFVISCSSVCVREIWRPKTNAERYI